MSSEARILIVDDEPFALQLIERILQGHGFKTFTASNSSDALQKVREEKPDLVILDVMIPGVDGFEVCRHLRRNPDTATLPVFMLTAKEEARAQLTGFEGRGPTITWSNRLNRKI
ncbi:MAG: response regulator [Anaerolineales bacterium]|nr:response regulator [Anaerolineales bacterium]